MTKSPEETQGKFNCLGCGQLVTPTQHHPIECCESFKAGAEAQLAKLASVTDKEMVEMGASELAEHLIRLGYLPIEPVQLEVLRDEKIKWELEKIQPEGFDWVSTTPNEMVKFKAISQATNVHNEAKGQLYRVKEVSNGK